MHKKDRLRVVVTGYGAFSPLGENAAASWDSILQYRMGYQRQPFADASIAAKIFGFITPDDRHYRGLPKRILKALPEFAKYALVAGREALAAAFGSTKVTDHYDPFEVGVIVGTGWGGCDSINHNNNDYRQQQFASSFSTLMSMPNAATAAVSMTWGLRGYQNTPVAACATGTMAIGDAVEVIRSGRARCVLAGGSESLREQFNVWSIDVIQALSKEQEDPARACCPFDKRRSGFVLSEGAAVLCLEELSAARARGATILGEVTGYANFTDSHDFTAPAPDLKARVRTIAVACEDAGLAPADIDYINAHGTSTPLNDLNESEAIKVALGDHARRVAISSTKSYSGHLIGAAGALEAVICLQAMASGTVPATRNLLEPDPECDLDYTAGQHRTGANLRRSLNLSFGFGGANAALVIERM
jgi:3-oxoacyl-[acyl-carrier-protein] synthase II